jgi:hypothetical protein
LSSSGRRRAKTVEVAIPSEASHICDGQLLLVPAHQSSQGFLDGGPPRRKAGSRHGSGQKFGVNLD